MIPGHDTTRHDLAPRRILVRGTRWIGDAVMTVPALRRLRTLFPHAHVALAAGAWARDLFDGADFVDEVLTVAAPPNASRAAIVWREARAWRAGRYDAAILFQNAFAAALTARLAGIPRRVGYATDGRGLLLTDRLPVPPWRGRRHEVFYYLDIVEQFARRFGAGRDASEDAAPRFVPDASLDVTSSRANAARELLRRRGIDLDDKARPLVALCPGSTNSRAKRWHAASYARLGDRLAAELGARIVLIGAAAERDAADHIAGMMRRPALVLAGELSLAESIAVLGLAALVVSNDTGTAHVAAALARPTIVVFGPTNPVTTAPFSATAIVMREPPACAPCMLRDCPIDHRCMTAVTPDAVFARAADILAATIVAPNDGRRAAPTLAAAELAAARSEA